VRFWVVLGGRETEVEFHEAPGKLMLEFEGRRLEADFRPLPDGEVYSLLVDGRSHEVSVLPAGERLEVMVRGQVFPVEVRNPLERSLRQVQHKQAAPGPAHVTAPMPGLVVSVLVKPGERVAAGTPVAVVEAMKMQNQLFAHGDAVVREVRVAPRQSVEAGQVLMTLAPVEAGAP
jgi:biotin carboxyl carrier protein